MFIVQPLQENGGGFQFRRAIMRIIDLICYALLYIKLRKTISGYFNICNFKKDLQCHWHINIDPFTYIAVIFHNK